MARSVKYMLAEEAKRPAQPDTAGTGFAGRLNLTSLPSEIIIYILQPLVPRWWNVPASGGNAHDNDNTGYCLKKLLDTRRVCKIFDIVITNELLLKCDKCLLLSDVPTMSGELISALIEAKYAVNKTPVAPFFQIPTDSWDALSAWANFHNVHLRIGKAAYIRKAHEAVIAFRWAAWIAPVLIDDVFDIPDVPRCDPMTSLKDALQVHGCMAVLAYAGEADAVRALVSHGCSSSTSHSYMGSPMYAAAYAGHLEIVQLLMLTNTHPVASFAGAGGNPIEVAAENGHTDVAVYLAQRNNNNSRHSALPNAIAAGHSSTAIALIDLDSRIDINFGRALGRTPLLLAMDHGDAAVLAYLGAERRIW